METQAGDQAESSSCPEGGAEQPLPVGRRQINFWQARGGGDIGAWVLNGNYFTSQWQGRLVCISRGGGLGRKEMDSR